MRIASALLAALAAAACTSRDATPARTTRPAPASIDELIADVSPARVRADVERLASFGTRHTLSAVEGERGIGAARRWLKDEFERAGDDSGRTGDDAIHVRFDVHRQPPGPRLPDGAEIVNVEAVIPGSMPESARRRVYMVAHYDSRATDAMDAVSDAPGANDDGSGVAALLESARVLSKRRFDCTIVLLTVAGEEQGLYGSRLHATAARERGDEIVAVLSDDIVGDPSGPAGASSRDAIRVFSEGLPRAASPDETKRIASLGGESDSPSRQLARYVAEVAEIHGTRVRPRLVFRTDRFLRGGDHLSFLEQGFPAVRFTDVHEKYDRQHQDVRTEGARRFGDLPEFVDAVYLADVTRLDAATLAHLANAPSAPANARIITADLSTDTLLRWTRSPESDVAGYEVVRRATTNATWEHATDVGDVAEAALPYSKDDWLFGLRAYDRDGFRSLVVFPAAARE